jgi:Xaa-Pro aminopeptidase
VSHAGNIHYLTGFTGSAGVLLVNERQAVFFTDGRYTEQARQQVRGASVVIARKAPLLAAAEWLQKHQKRRMVVGIEATHMAVAERDRLAKLLPKNIRIKPTPPMLEQMRMVKDAGEVELMRSAAVLGSGLFPVLKEKIRPGKTEIDVACELEYAARKAGADGMSFETIIAAGPRAALPHGRASREKIPRSGFVVCDFGVILAGYCSDMTRTFFVGHADDEARTFYSAVREAQQAAVEAVRPGVPVSDIDSAARNILKKAGLGRFFTHSTGHGVGLEIHELPRIAGRQQEILQPGMVITIEPGAYVPRKWGVRIEDMVVVTDAGCEVLTPTTKEMICI